MPFTASIKSLSRRSFRSRAAGADGAGALFSGVIGTDESVTCVRDCKEDSGRGNRVGRALSGLPIFLLGAGQQLEERIEAAVERASKLRNRPVDRVKRQPCLR